jgi:elongation factor Tu
MMARNIIGVIGHSKHGKTTLAQALEQAVDKSDVVIVDDPDAAVYSKLHAALLVVSAADGPMPGTRLALEQAQQDGVASLIAYLSKCDLVDDDFLLELVEMEVKELAETFGYDNLSITRGRISQLKSDSPPIAELVAML